MILRRLGNKSKLAKEIQQYFPPHKIYIEPFFGAGGMFFNKPKADRNILNDIDCDVYNLFELIKENPNELKEKLSLTPPCEMLFNIWKNKTEEDSVWAAVRFIYLSNFGIFGGVSTMQVSSRNHKKRALENFDKTIEFLKDITTIFLNSDFRNMFSKISFSEENNNKNTFIYCDPPYLGTNDNYSHSFTEQDSIDLFDCLEKTGCKWAMSEFDNTFILEQAEKRNLNVIYIGERQNLKNRRTEILVTNYKTNPTLF